MIDNDFDLDAYVEASIRESLEPRASGNILRMVGVTPPAANALPETLESVLANLKVNACEPRACGFCKRDAPATGCDDGWHYGSSGARMCQHQRTRLETQRLTDAMTLIGLDETKFARGWNELKLTHESWRTAHSIASRLKAMRETGMNVYLWGALGRGKTHAGLLLIREALRLRMSAVHTQWSEFTRHVRATYRDDAAHSEHHLVRAVTAPDFLLIDEIKDDLSDFSRRLLSEIIQTRDNALRPTIITANLTPDELREAMDQRSSDRFEARCMNVMFDGPKYRDVEAASVAALQASILRAASSGGVA